MGILTEDVACNLRGDILILAQPFLYRLCAQPCLYRFCAYTRPRYRVSVYRTIRPMVLFLTGRFSPTRTRLKRINTFKTCNSKGMQIFNNCMF